jgi:hypothetical protein
MTTSVKQNPPHHRDHRPCHQTRRTFLVSALADGTDVVVIGVTENFSASGWEQEVAIGNLP